MSASILRVLHQTYSRHGAETTPGPEMGQIPEHLSMISTCFGLTLNLVASSVPKTYSRMAGFDLEWSLERLLIVLEQPRGDATPFIELPEQTLAAVAIEVV